jgi:DNA-nicking Smr family endonuclease
MSKRRLSEEEHALWQETVLRALVVTTDSLLPSNHRLSNKKNTIEAKIDLHGLSLAKAHQQCLAFLKTHQALGHRRVLIITGKGNLSAAKGETLRSALPSWLETAEAKKLVSTVSEAPRRLGGAGAYVVVLRPLYREIPPEHLY